LVETAERFGIVQALRSFHDRQKTLTILAYHRVLPTDALESYPFDRELISATPAQFESQMLYLRRHMHPVPLSAVLAHLEGSSVLPPAAVAVTFDDGFADTYRYAFPILKRYAIPATVFLTTGYVDSGEPFWFELVAFLTFRVNPGVLVIEDIRGLTRAFPSGNSHQERTQSLRQLHEILKELPNSRRAENIERWSRHFASLIAYGALGHSRPINWEQVREMAAAHIEFGSHTVTHPNLTQLADETLDRELAESKRVIEERLQHSVNLFAYPIGTASAFNPRVIEATRRNGFQLAATYIAGANPLHNLKRYELRRQGIGLGTTPRYFRALTSLPLWLD
jgi:peptidoglycan/xylan/chitin deacetylase (PgdA/CDA1 family)